MKKESFWSQQPVGSNETKDIIEIRTEPYTLPKGFVFTNISDTQELSTFLNINYVEDDDEEFRLLYSPKFLKWMLSNPKHKEEYSLGLKFNNKLVGYIFGKETNLNINGTKKKVAAVNFLCVVKEMRHKRIAPSLIMELTRRFNCNSIFSGVFTAGIDFFFNVVSCKYFHLPLNGERLYKANFTSQILNTRIQKGRSYTRRVKEGDVEEIFKLYKDNIGKYEMVEDMDIEDFKWYVCDSEMSVYVNEKNNKITSFGMYYTLDTLSIHKQCNITGAYLAFVCEEYTTMVGDLVYYALQENIDVFNCLDIAQNKEVIEDMDFIEGTGELKYYLYNWKCPAINKSDVFFYLV